MSFYAGQLFQVNFSLLTDQDQCGRNSARLGRDILFYLYHAAGGSSVQCSAPHLKPGEVTMFNRILKLRYLELALLAVMAIFSVVSCGGGGSSGTGQNVPTGSVSLLVTDLPTADYCAINVTITGALLISDFGQVTLYSNPAGKTLNLLNLAHYSEIFSHTTGVPAGTYSKIRLILGGDVVLKPVASCNDVTTWITARVPSGKLDLNPQGDFTVPANGVLIVELDMAAKAFKLTQTGNGGYLVRPVVFVNVISDTRIGKLIRVFGTVENKLVTGDGGSFDLCGTAIFWHDDKSGDTANHCVLVQINGTTSLFNALGDPAMFADLNNGDPATVIGRLVMANTAMSDPSVALNAEVVEIGAHGVFGRYNGIVRSLPATADAPFDLELYPPQGILSGTIVPVDLQTGTKLYSRIGDPIGIGDFALGLYAHTEGVLVIGTEDYIKPAVVWLDLNANQMLYEGSVDPTSVDLTTRSFTLMPSSAPLASDRVVVLSSDAVILLVSVNGSVMSNTRINLADMAALTGVYNAEVYGVEQTDGTILSDRVILQAQ